jgi:predicted O-linked N-acetylglucosamine transferase (SPINDLY family)
MRRKARRLTASLLNSSGEFWRKAHIGPEDGLLSKTNKIYKHILWREPKQAEEFLSSALSCIRRNEIQHALSTLEAGLNNYPESDILLAAYLRICCAQEQLTRFIDFITPAKKQLCMTLAGLDISSTAPDDQSIDDRQEHGVICLTWELIDKNFSDDVLKLWRLADLMEHAAKNDVANKIHHQLSSRATHAPEDYLYSGVSDMRLGNINTGFNKLTEGLAAYPQSEALRSVFKDCCSSLSAFDRYQRLKAVVGNDETESPGEALDFYRHALKVSPLEQFFLKFRDMESNCSADDFLVLKEEFLEQLRYSELKLEKAKLAIFFSKALDLDADFSEKIFLIFYSIDWGRDNEAAKYALKLIYNLTLPCVPAPASDAGDVIDQFVADAHECSRKPTELRDPIADFGLYWANWQSLFCLVHHKKYSHAISAFERLAFKLWPKLDFTAPHINRRARSHGAHGRKIRIGFTVLDAMPMMSGFMERLDRTIFETVYLRPGKAGESRTGNDWVSRAGKIVEYSDADAYSAINTIADQELDILISGPSVPQIFFPLMARLAHLQMVLLEPNWPDGIRNNDYYISWQMAEPENYKEFYNTSVSLLRTPPYWIEKTSLGQTPAISDQTSNAIRRRLLRLGPQDRFYLCANTPPKIHPVMDEVFRKLLEMDPAASLVFLRGEHAMAQPLKARLNKTLGRYNDKIIFLDTLSRDDAHSLLLAADCCLDSYPICGMSSSFDGFMLGVPIVTLPTDIPFGRWTAAIYEYIGVSGLTAGNIDEYIDIAIKLAKDKDCRLQKSAEIREKSSRYVESMESFDEFQHFIIQAWRRKQAGLPPGNWVAGEWQ